jgi:hypothetical protein
VYRLFTEVSQLNKQRDEIESTQTASHLVQEIKTRHSDAETAILKSVIRARRKIKTKCLRLLEFGNASHFYRG